MSTFDTPTVPMQPARAGRRRGIQVRSVLAKSFGWLSRPRRVLLVLAAVWVINVFDLGYTLAESLYSGFIEMNPLAAKLVAGPPAVLVSYKTALLTVSSTILLIHRRHRVAELGCWFLLGVYLYVAVCWWLYYEHRLASFDDPAINVDPVVGCCLPY